MLAHVLDFSTPLERYIQFNGKFILIAKYFFKNLNYTFYLEYDAIFSSTYVYWVCIA